MPHTASRCWGFIGRFTADFFSPMMAVIQNIDGLETMIQTDSRPKLSDDEVNIPQRIRY
jgi:hypothetical protein